jgi:hypothetical protein
MPMIGVSNPVGTGSGLNYAGSFAYAYSGSLTCTSSGTTMLQFTTGAELINARFQFSWGDGTQNYDVQPEIKFDSQTIIKQYIQTGQQANPNDLPDYHLIIPPFTKVEVIQTAQADTPQCTATIAGDLHA